MTKILITGATGNLGKLVITHLLKTIKSENLAVLVRKADDLGALKLQGLDARLGDYSDYESLVKAFNGIDKLFFISGSEFVGRSQHHENVIKAAKKAGVKHVVYTSFQRKNETKTSPMAFVIEDHIYTENLLKESGLTYTILKHNLYMDMLPLFIGDKVLETGLIYQPTGDGKTAFTLRDDMAELAGHILTSEGHENKTYDVSTDMAYSYQEITALITKLTGKEIRYTSPSVEEFTNTLKKADVPDEYIGLFKGFALAIKDGELDKTSTIFEQMIGRKATTLETFLCEVYV
tara:strand:- start:580 stop:1452 length:873 start_codon:yes stop_codon:yes gene_type:complete